MMAWSYDFQEHAHTVKTHVSHSPSSCNGGTSSGHPDIPSKVSLLLPASTGHPDIPPKVSLLLLVSSRPLLPGSHVDITSTKRTCWQMNVNRVNDSSLSTRKHCSPVTSETVGISITLSHLKMNRVLKII